MREKIKELKNLEKKVDELENTIKDELYSKYKDDFEIAKENYIKKYLMEDKYDEFGIYLDLFYISDTDKFYVKQIKTLINEIFLCNVENDFFNYKINFKENKIIIYDNIVFILKLKDMYDFYSTQPMIKIPIDILFNLDEKIINKIKFLISV